MVQQWNKLDSEAQEALLNWYNVRQNCITNADKALLAKLYCSGQFCYGTCAHCGVAYYHGHPDDWSEFQGVHEIASYGELCEECYSCYLTLKELAGD